MCAAISVRAWLAFGAVVLALALPWYLAVCLRLPEFGTYFFWQHNVLRFAQPFDHERPVWFYVPIMLAGLLPVTLLLPWFAGFLLSGNEGVAAKRSRELGYLLLTGGGCVFFFSLSGCKLPTYVLPAFAPLCLAAGCFVAQTSWHASRWSYGIVTVCGLMLAGTHAVFIPWYAAERSTLNGPGPLLEVCRDPRVPIVCFPRHVDSLAFYLGRSDFRSFRSKELGKLLAFLDEHPRVVVVFGHRNSLGALQRHLPPHLDVTATAPMGLCDMAVIERVR
jgi:hypothetical protein